MKQKRDEDKKEIERDFGIKVLYSYKTWTNI